MMKFPMFCIIVILLTACEQTVNPSEEVGVLTLADMPMFDTTGLQSVYYHKSPYEVKGVLAPEDDPDFGKPYNKFEFIDNYYKDLKSMGYSVNSPVEFYTKFLNDTNWAKIAYDTLFVHSTATYMGSKQGLIDSIKNINKILSQPLTSVSLLPVKSKYE